MVSTTCAPPWITRRSGNGRLVLIGGEPGIGKSRLADELLPAGSRRRAPERTWGRGWEDAGAPPYWPWVQILRTDIRGADRESVRIQLGGRCRRGPNASGALWLFPELTVRSASESDTARFQLFDATATFLRQAAAVRPLVAVLDDLQAADEPSILLLRFLASQLNDMRLLVVGTYRDVALTPDHPLTTAVVELTREPTTRLLTLPGLDVGSLGEFIGFETGVVPDTRAVAAVWRETKGNPLFVREAVRLLSAEGRLDAAAGCHCCGSKFPLACARSSLGA